VNEIVDKDAVHTFHEVIVFVDWAVFFIVMPALDFPKGAFDGRSEIATSSLEAFSHVGDTEGESGNTWDTFSGTVQGIKSRQYIKGFPFEPKIFYIGVTREMLPVDWEEEPFFQDKDYYNISEFEATGVKNWIPGDKYRYVIKDMKQLDEVWEYYKK
jgi:hypothetical protein